MNDTNQRNDGALSLAPIIDLRSARLSVGRWPSCSHPPVVTERAAGSGMPRVG